MPNPESIVLEVDEAPARAAVDRANKGIDQYEKQTGRALNSTGRSWESYGRTVSRSVDQSKSSLEKYVLAIEAYGHAVERAGNSTERAFRGLASATKGFFEFAGAIALGTKALAAHASVAEVAEGAINRVRAARVGVAAFTEGVAGAAAAAGQIAAVIAVERAAEATYARAQQLQQQALQSARSGLSYGDTVTVDFASQRAAVSPEFFTRTAQAAGGVEQLGDELKRLADIRDPLLQASEAYKEFGADTEQILKLTGDRFSENIKLVRDYGLALDQTSRENISGFKRDVDSLRNSFEGLGDEIKAWGSNFGLWIEKDLAGVYALIRHGVPDLIGGIGKWLGVTEDTLDVKSLGGGFNKQSRQTVLENQSADQLLQDFSTQGTLATRFYQQNQTTDESALRSRISNLANSLFDQDPTSKTYGALKSGAQFPGGYRAQASAEQLYISSTQRLAQLEKEKTLTEQIAAAEKSITAELEKGNAYGRFVEQFSILKQGTPGQQAQYQAGLAGVQRQVTGQFYSRIAATNEKAAQQELEQIAARNRVEESMERLLTEQAKQQTLERDHRDGMQGFAGIQPTSASSSAIQQRMQAVLEADLNSARAQPGADPIALAQKEFNLKKQAADYDLKAAGDTFDARYSYETRLFQLQMEFQNQLDQQRRKQFDELKSTAGGLINTLFTHPSQFGKQFAGTIRSAALRPAVEGLSGLTATVLHPLIYGPDGQSGIAGMFGGFAHMGGLQDLRLVGGAVPVVVVGGGTTATRGGGGFAGGGISGGPIFSSGTGSITGGPGGTSGFTGPVGMSGAGGPAGLRGLGGIAGMFSKQNWSNLGANFGVGQAEVGPPASGYTLDANGNAMQPQMGTTFGSVLSSRGAASLMTSIGTPLAIAGASGVNRGTGTGIAELTAGGALTGAGIGTMILPGVGTAIGAGIGAAAGALTGVGEMLAGVQSPRDLVESLVKQRYHISINHQMADQIVQLAKQKFLSNYSVAVSSPDVRQMLGVYAAGTNQSSKFPMSATTPMGASFADVGGKLYQQSTYQYGNAYAYGSSAPTLGGNNNVGSIPAPNVQLAVNVSGAGLAPFMTGQYVTPDLVQQQGAAAWQASSGRTDDSMTMQEPGTIIS